MLFIVEAIALQQNNAKSCLDLFHNCLFVMIKKRIYGSILHINNTYNQSLTEKHGIL